MIICEHKLQAKLIGSSMHCKCKLHNTKYTHFGMYTLLAKPRKFDLKKIQMSSHLQMF